MSSRSTPVASSPHLQQNLPTSMSRNDVPHPPAAADPPPHGNSSTGHSPPDGPASSSSSPPPPEPKRHHKKWLLSLLRWGIAAVGIWYVLSNISLSDRVMYLSPTSQPITAR